MARATLEVPVTSSAGLSVQHLTRRFEGTLAVDDVSFDIHPGELVALVGASGSGKTTSLRIIAGYDVPDAGRVLFAGADITRLPPERRGFGMVFQHYALFPHMSVLENVAFGLEARRVPKAERHRRAEQALDNVGLGGKGGRRVQQLSGGEQQRVALARAVVIEPKVLLLDEPLSNLDPALRQSTRDDLRTMLRRVGAPALFVTHDQEDAFAVADRIVVLSRGRILQVGTPAELYAHPASREIAAFIGRAALVPARDRGATASVTIAGVTRELTVTRPVTQDARSTISGTTSSIPRGTASGSTASDDAFVVLRPESLAMAPADAAETWPGVITARRFAGATYVYQVRLSDTVTVEVVSTQSVAEGTAVGVSATGAPVPLVAQ